MVTQSGNVGVNALGSRRGIGWHTVVSTGNEAVCSTERLARGARRGATGVRLDRPLLESDGDGARLAEALAALRRARRRRRGAQGRQPPRPARARRRRTPARWPATSASSAALVEEAGAAWAERLPRPARAREGARRAARARPRGDGGLAVLTCSGGDSGVAADLAETLGLELPELAPPTRERLAGAAARRGDDRQPARLHGDDLGRHAAARRDRRDGRRRPGDRPAAAPLRPAGRPPTTRGTRSAPGSPTARGASERRRDRRLDPARPARPGERGRARRRRACRRSPGCGRRSSARRALRASGGDPERLREIAEFAAASGELRASGSTRRMPRSSCGRAGSPWSMERRSARGMSASPLRRSSATRWR